MLNYRSARSSTLQVRSNPALRAVNPSSGFQKRIRTLLEPLTLPFPTFQRVRDTSQTSLQQYQYYAWIRPAHLRSQWIVLAEGCPVLLVDPKTLMIKWSLRIPFDTQQIQSIGPILLEGAWDAQDHCLWIWDVLTWEKQTIWSTTPYSTRWMHLQTIIRSILDCGHPMSDADVRLPTWTRYADLLTQSEIDPSMSIEFQPEKAGQRRLLYLVNDTSVKFTPTNYAERQMVAKDSFSKGCAIQTDDHHQDTTTTTTKPTMKPTMKPTNPQSVPSTVHVKQVHDHTQEDIRMTLSKDTHTKLPDSYRLLDTDGKDRGLAAIRSVTMSKALRDLSMTSSSIPVIVRWYEPFQKFEVRQIDT